MTTIDDMPDEPTPSILGRCPDQGTCHHGCPTAVACYRVGCCAPIGGAFPGGTWPDDVRAAHAAETDAPRTDGLAPPSDGDVTGPDPGAAVVVEPGDLVEIDVPAWADQLAAEQAAPSCETCDGQGRVPATTGHPGDGYDPCPACSCQTCGGRGIVPYVGAGTGDDHEACPDCTPPTLGVVTSSGPISLADFVEHGAHRLSDGTVVRGDEPMFDDDPVYDEAGTRLDVPGGPADPAAWNPTVPAPVGLDWVNRDPSPTLQAGRVRQGLATEAAVAVDRWTGGERPEFADQADAINSYADGYVAYAHDVATAIGADPLAPALVAARMAALDDGCRWLTVAEARRAIGEAAQAAAAANPAHPYAAMADSLEESRPGMSGRPAAGRAATGGYPYDQIGRGRQDSDHEPGIRYDRVDVPALVEQARALAEAAGFRPMPVPYTSVLRHQPDGRSPHEHPATFDVPAPLAHRGPNPWRRPIIAGPAGLAVGAAGLAAGMAAVDLERAEQQHRALQADVANLAGVSPDQLDHLTRADLEAIRYSLSFRPDLAAAWRDIIASGRPIPASDALLPATPPRELPRGESEPMSPPGPLERLAAWWRNRRSARA